MNETEMIAEVDGYVEDTMMMALDDDWPDAEERCLDYIQDELNVDTDMAQYLFNQIMEINRVS